MSSSKHSPALGVSKTFLKRQYVRPVGVGSSPDTLLSVLLSEILEFEESVSGFKIAAGSLVKSGVVRNRSDRTDLAIKHPPQPFERARVDDGVRVEQDQVFAAREAPRPTLQPAEKPRFFSLAISRSLSVRGRNCSTSRTVPHEALSATITSSPSFNASRTLCRQFPIVPTEL